MRNLVIIFSVICFSYCVAALSDSLILRHLVKRQQAGIGGGAGGGLGASTGLAQASTPGGVSNVTTTTGALGGGGGGVFQISTIFGGATGDFGAGIGAGVGVAASEGEETIANVDTISSGSGAGAGVNVGGPIGK